MPELDNELTLFHSPATPDIFSGQTGIVDTTNCVIKGVSLITGDCVAEGHDLHVDSTTVSQLHALAKTKGKVPVNLDHGSGIKDMNGYVTNVRMDGAKMRGDWHLLKNHTETPLMLERATEMPECFGLSVAFKGKGVAVKGGKKAARAEKLLSVDCVTRPAANQEGLFGARDGKPVDMSKKSMAEENKTTTASIDDVLAAVGKISTRLDGLEATTKGIVDHINEGAQNPEAERERLEALYKATDAELEAAGVTREEVNQAVAEWNAAIEADASDGEGDGEGDGGDKGEGKGEGEGAGAPAAALAGVEGSTAMKALAKEVINLRAEINADKAAKKLAAEEMEFSAIEGKMVTLATMRDNAIELAERLVVENEALRIALRTGTRPVKPGIDRDHRFFSAGEDGELHAFQKLVKDIQGKKDGRTEGEAIQLAIKEQPALHIDWLQSQSNQTIRS